MNAPLRHSRWPRRGLRVGCLLALVAFGIGGSSHAEITGSITAPSSVRSWTVKFAGSETKVSQFYVPITGRLALNRTVDLVVATAGAGSHTEGSGSSTDLSGAAAIQSQLLAMFMDRRLLVQGGVSIPSGKRSLNARELGVAQMISLPVLGFGLRHYGRGLEWAGGASLAIPLPSGALGSIGVGGVIRESYELVEGQAGFRPAPELAITAGADVGESVERRGRPLRVDLTYRGFGKDKQSGRTVFEEGGQLELQAQVRRGQERFQALGFVRAVVKGDNTAMGPVGSTVGALKASSGNSVTSQLRGSWPWRVNVRVGLEGEWSLVSGSDSFGRNGHAIGFGPALDCSLGNGLGIGVRALYLRGSLDGPPSTGDVDLSGTSFSALLRWAPPS